MRLGAFDYISKPVTQEILLRAVALALRHKALDDERERYHRNLEAIFASVQDGVVSVDDTMVITHANDAIDNFFLLPSEQLPGKSIREVVRPTFSSCIEVLEKTMQTREPVREFRTEATAKDGRQMVVVINCSLLIDRDGTFMGSVLVLRDISRITNLERELQERQFFHKIIGKSAIMQDIYTRIGLLPKPIPPFLLPEEAERQGTYRRSNTLQRLPGFKAAGQV